MKTASVSGGGWDVQDLGATPSKTMTNINLRYMRDI